MIGMLAAHLGPQWWQPGAPAWWTVAQGPSALLFVVLTGAVLTRTGMPTPEVLRRAAGIGVLGLALAATPSPIDVILPVTAVLMAAGCLLRRLPTNLLAALLITLLAGTPGLVAAIRAGTVAPGGELSPALLASDPLGAALLLTATGTFPAMVWLVPLTLGMLIGRLQLNAQATARTVAGGALAVLLASGATTLALRGHLVPFPDAAQTLSLRPGGVPSPTWSWLLGAWPHAGTWLELSHGLALAVLVITVPAAQLARPGRLLTPLTTLGRVPLTFYSAQVLLLAALPFAATSSLPTAAALVALLTVTAAITARRWLITHPRGPLETLLARYARRP